MEPETVHYQTNSAIGSLILTTPQASHRYSPAEVQVNPLSLSAMYGMCEEQLEVSKSWASYVNPEGRRYFICSAPFRVVTEAYLWRPEIRKKISSWITRIEAILSETKINRSEDTELFLQLEGDNCGYYFADHNARTLFWLDQATTDDLGINPVASPSHLFIALEEMYWTHVEYFPMHIDGIPQHLYDTLSNIFAHSLADQITSETSTVPFNITECERVIKLLEVSRPNMKDGHITCIVARLWSQVCNHRFFIHYGEEYARLSRDQTILGPDPPQESRWLDTIISGFSFGVWGDYVSRLNDLYVDGVVYVDHWKEFMTFCLQDWKDVLYMDIALLLLITMASSVPMAKSLVVASTTCIVTSFLTSTAMIQRHRILAAASCNEAHWYLSNICLERYKFKLAALAYAIPRISHFWGILILALNVALTLVTVLSGVWALCIISSLVLILAAIYHVTSTSDWSLSALLCPFRSPVESLPV